jgi:carbon-monoxide dehydrogenase large subunit
VDQEVDGTDRGQDPERGGDWRILGTSVRRGEDARFLTVGGWYLEDIPLDGAGFVVYVRSTVAHARIAGVDTTGAVASPGVIAVFTSTDLDLDPLRSGPPDADPSMVRPWLATDVVRFVGETVAAVVAETWAQAVDAAELVIVDYEELPVIVDPDDALDDFTLLFPDAGTNVALAFDFTTERAVQADLRSSEAPFGGLFDGCDVVVELAIRNPRVAPCPMEPRAAAARFDDCGLTYWTSSQAPFGVRAAITRVYGLQPSEIRVIAPDVGGGFGAKISPYQDELLTIWLARKLDRPVRWSETRSESMLSLGHGRAQYQHVTMGGNRDGSIHAYALDVIQDAGAYPGSGASLPRMTQLMLTGVYHIPRCAFRNRSVVTNTNPVVAYRGAGRPEAAAAIERAVDLFAAEIGMDPGEVRRRNLIRAGAFPHRTPSGAVYDSGDYERALELVLNTAGYSELRREQAEKRASGGAWQMGIGMAVYVEITNVTRESEFGCVEVVGDGTARVLTGSTPAGQGHSTTWAMIAAEELGLPLENIEVVHSDTALIPRGVGTYSSKSAQTGGVAIQQAARAVVEAGRQMVADLLEASHLDVVLDKREGRFHVVGIPSVTKSWAEVARDSGTGKLSCESDFMADGPSFPFGAHLVVVDVDLDTGIVTLRRVVAVDDCGTLLNPLLADGQVKGGLAQGLAQALFEEFRYDEAGNPLTSNFSDYPIVTACELPPFETVSMETPSPMNQLGAKGVGESGTIGSTPAAQNAVVDAVAHLGVRHIDMPTDPERVWRAVMDVTVRHKRDGSSVPASLDAGLPGFAADDAKESR